MSCTPKREYQRSTAALATALRMPFSLEPSIASTSGCESVSSCATPLSRLSSSSSDIERPAAICLSTGSTSSRFFSAMFFWQLARICFALRSTRACLFEVSS